ncbi:heterokaryon incompatibility protein-domain-containing protein [Xylaria curta]|nr:heterokaryon incompatibility protein-domain-containing protein [Xylaria curta]
MSGSLCDTCAEFPFDVSDPPFSASHAFRRGSMRTFRLGRLEAIADRNCVFCRLVLQATLRLRQTDPSIRQALESPYYDDIMVWLLRDGSRSGLYIYLHPGMISMGTMIGVVYEPGPKFPALVPRNESVFYTPVRAHIDFGTVGKWLSTCKNNHGETCHKAYSEPESPQQKLSSLPRGMRVIRFLDVEKECIVELQHMPSYVALSYVWGAAPTIRLSDANRNDFMRPNVLQRIWRHLPITIRDTITVVQRLNQKYLWVDSLCLIQNNQTDMDEGVRFMDLIYELSTLTIVAASGSDANAGLPGVRIGSRTVESSIAEVIPGLKLGIYTIGDDQVEPTVYNSRAWTFQEYVLSPRVLCFMNDRVFFRCRKVTYSEDSHGERMLHKPLWEEPPDYHISAALNMDFPVENFKKVIVHCNRRVLSYPADIERAMAGIIQRFSTRMQCEFLHGIPTAIFDSFLLFSTTSTPLKRREGCPSYSWMGWAGSVGFPADQKFASIDAEIKWLRDCTWIIWYKRDRQGVESLVWDPSANKSPLFASLSDPGCYRTTGWPRSFDIKESSYGVMYKTETSNIPSYPLLKFQTWSQYYKLSITDSFVGSATLFDDDGTECGWLTLDGFEQMDFFNKIEKVEVILLSRLREDLEDHHYAMCLEWKNGIAERRGMGKVVAKISSPELRWKHIVLG